MGRHRSTDYAVIRCSPRTARLWKETAALQRLITGKTAGQMLGSMLMARRQYLIRLAIKRGIDISSLKVRGKPAPPMPDITRIDPFAQP